MNRLFKEGWVTTILGVVAIICGIYVYMHVTKEPSDVEIASDLATQKNIAAGALVGLGTLLLRIKDTALGKKNKSE